MKRLKEKQKEWIPLITVGLVFYGLEKKIRKQFHFNQIQFQGNYQQCTMWHMHQLCCKVPNWQLCVFLICHCFKVLVVASIFID